jgi:hypothetical protein
MYDYDNGNSFDVLRTEIIQTISDVVQNMKTNGGPEAEKVTELINMSIKAGEIEQELNKLSNDFYKLRESTRPK